MLSLDTLVKNLWKTEWHVLFVNLHSKISCHYLNCKTYSVKQPWFILLSREKTKPEKKKKTLQPFKLELKLSQPQMSFFHASMCTYFLFFPFLHVHCRSNIQENVDLIKLQRDIKEKATKFEALQAKYFNLEEVRHHSNLVQCRL